jgi:hypothetical protein
MFHIDLQTLIRSIFYGAYCHSVRWTVSEKINFDFSFKQSMGYTGSILIAQEVSPIPSTSGHTYCCEDAQRKLSITTDDPFPWVLTPNTDD